MEGQYSTRKAGLGYRVSTSKQTTYLFIRGLAGIEFELIRRHYFYALI